MSRSDRGVPLRAASLPTSPFRRGFAKGATSRSDRGVHPSEQLRCPPPLSGEALQKGRCHAVTEGSPLRAASLPTSPFREGFAKGTCSNLSPLKGEMSRSDRGADPPEQLRCPPPRSRRLYKNKNSRVHRLDVPAVFCSHVKLCDSSSMNF